MSETPDYLNPSRIYTDGQHEVGVSKMESTTDPLPFEPDEDEYKPVIYPPRTSCGLLEEE